MEAYRTYVTILDPKQVVIKDVPFRSGQHVEVLLIVHNPEAQSPAHELRTLLKETRALPQVQALSEADIAAEIALYRQQVLAGSGV